MENKVLGEWSKVSKNFSAQTQKDFADLVALLSDKDSSDAIFESLKEMDSKKAQTLEKSITSLYNKLHKLA